MTNQKPSWELLEKLHSGQLKETEQIALRTKIAQDPELQQASLYLLFEQLREEHLPPHQLLEALTKQSGAPPQAAMEFLAQENDFRFVAHNPRLFAAYKEAKKVTIGMTFAPPPSRWRLLRHRSFVIAASLFLVVLAIFWWKFPAISSFFQQDEPSAWQIEEFPDYPFLFEHYDQAMDAYDNQDYQQALYQLEAIQVQLLKENPEETLTINGINFYISACNFRLGNLGQARVILERLVVEGSNLMGQPEVLFLGAVHYHLHNYQAARSWMQEAQQSVGFLKEGVPISSVANRYLAVLGEQ